MAAKVAMVTGAGRGIGAATAEFLARSGWSVALVDACESSGPAACGPAPATAEDLARAAQRCREHAPALEIVADVRSVSAIAAAVQRAEDELGEIGAAVAAAGRIGGGLAWQTEESIWAELIDVNLHGVRRLAEAVLPRFLGRGEGRFIAVASAAATRGLGRLSAYSASKHAVVGFIRGLAADLAETEVTANAICPGSTDTAMLDASAEVYGLQGREEFARHQLLGRLLRPEEVAAAIAFLCGPEASAITGAVIPVDGGMTV